MMKLVTMQLMMMITMMMMLSMLNIIGIMGTSEDMLPLSLDQSLIFLLIGSRMITMIMISEDESDR